ncbi:ADP-ribosylation factor 4 [Orobanche hederae]
MAASPFLVELLKTASLLSCNYEERRPTQELVATDLHGVQWKFRHIYRGQPRRHLLTTGWSAFVSRKNLVSSDAVLFMRGEAGEVRLGIRRAAQPRKNLPRTLIKNQLSHVANAFSTNAIFNVVYSPMSTHSNFVVPYSKYLECTTSRILVGTTFEMKYDLDDSPERRLRGVVTGVSGVDPCRWPNSKWRSLISVGMAWSISRNGFLIYLRLPEFKETQVESADISNWL